MSLTFGAATSDKVIVSSIAAIEGLDPFTFLGWVYPTTLTNYKAIYEKSNSAENCMGRLRLDGTGGNLNFVKIGVTSYDYITNNTPLATLNKWYFVAVTFNSGNAAGEKVNIYVGSLTEDMVECTYGTSIDGVSPEADGGGSFAVGNRSITSPVSAFQGRIAHASFWNIEMSLNDIRNRKLRPMMGPGCKLFWDLGLYGTGIQPDLSGSALHGTVTGATLNIDPPLGFPFGWDVGVPYRIIPSGPVPTISRVVMCG